MGKRVFKMFVLLLCMCPTVGAQQVTTGTEQQLENISEVTESETEDDSYLMQLQYFLNHPVNINTATEEELQIFKTLSSLQIYHLLQYRKNFGALLHLYELQAIPMWDVATIKKILPYITVQPKMDERVFKMFADGDHNFLLRSSQVLEKQKGFQNVITHYAGSRQRLLFRYRYQFKNLFQYGITGDKDAGEQFFKGAQKKGFDFYSFHVFARKLGAIKSLAVGDYVINLGQGLVQWQSLAFKKSAEVLAIEKAAPVLLPYQSAGEFYYNRGLAATIGHKKWESTLFASYKKMDAHIVDDSLNNESYFTSFGTSGYHRTASEIEKKNALLQTSFGGNISYKTTSFKMGLNGVKYLFSHALNKTNEPYNLYAISQDNWFNGSIDFAATYKNLHLFGEAAVDQKGKKAFINGAIISVDPKIDVAILYRNIGASYQTLYGNAFTENALPTNENGFYTGISIRPVEGIKIQAYADVYRFPWLKYRLNAPGAGKDYLLQATYQPDKKMELYARYRFEQKTQNVTDDLLPLNYTSPYQKQNMRVHLVYNVNRMFLIKSRVEAVWYQMQLKKEEGFLAFIEGAAKPVNSLSVNLRLQWFETGGYNSRIYTYENDVLYSYSIPAFFDKGMRYYINMNYDVTKKITAWLRFAQTVYQQKEVVGTGLDASLGNHRSEIKLQLMMVL